VVGWAGEVQLVGIGRAVGMPVRGVVHFALVTPDGAAGPGATLVTGMADDALIGGGDAGAAPQIDRPLGMARRAPPGSECRCPPSGSDPA
jgi:hypothetical protein